MHEMSLCEAILNILQEQAGVQSFQRVKTVWLEIGSLACVEPAAMEFGFEVVSRGTLAEGSRLEIIPIPAEAWCEQCAEQVEITERYHPCPRCGGYQLKVRGGDEMRIKELEVE